MYAMARLICKHPQVVRQWIESGPLSAENAALDDIAAGGSKFPEDKSGPHCWQH